MASTHLAQSSGWWALRPVSSAKTQQRGHFWPGAAATSTASGPSASVTLETMKRLASSSRADSRSLRCSPSARTVSAASVLLPISLAARAVSSDFCATSRTEKRAA